MMRVAGRLTWTHLIAFIVGAAVTMFLAWGWNESVRVGITTLEQKNLVLERDLGFAIKRGVYLEAQLILCREGRKVTQQLEAGKFYK